MLLDLYPQRVITETTSKSLSQKVLSVKNRHVMSRIDAKKVAQKSEHQALYSTGGFYIIMFIKNKQIWWLQYIYSFKLKFASVFFVN